MSTFEFGTSTQKTQLDVLHFQKSNQFWYSKLATIVCDMLAVPVSSVVSEAYFSVGGRVLDAFRSSLKPNMAEAVVCTKDWLFSKKGNIKLSITLTLYCIIFNLI